MLYSYISSLCDICNDEVVYLLIKSIDVIEKTDDYRILNNIIVCKFAKNIKDSVLIFFNKDIRTSGIEINHFCFILNFRKIYNL